MAKTTKELIAEIEELKAQIEQQEEPEAEAEETSEEETTEEPEVEAEETDNEELFKLRREFKSLKREMSSLTREVVKAKSQKAETVQVLPEYMSSEVKKDKFGNYYAEWNYDVFRNSNLR
jgi:seryl-tRNA synthetase|tara:strand:+ start:1106 stop:1465 length:360 start_codon:yes stop_codon:yes gene_type:complete